MEKEGFVFESLVDSHRFSDGSSSPAYRLSLYSGRDGSYQGEYFMPAMFDAVIGKGLSMREEPGLALDVLNRDYFMGNLNAPKAKLEELVHNAPQKTKQLVHEVSEYYPLMLSTVARGLEDFQKALDKNRLGMQLGVTDTPHLKELGCETQGRIGYSLVGFITSKDDSSKRLGYDANKPFVFGVLRDSNGRSDNPKEMVKKVMQQLENRANWFVKHYEKQGISLAEISEKDGEYHDLSKRFVKSVEQGLGIDLGVSKKEEVLHEFPKFSMDRGSKPSLNIKDNDERSKTNSGYADGK